MLSYHVSKTYKGKIGGAEKAPEKAPVMVFTTAGMPCVGTKKLRSGAKDAFLSPTAKKLRQIMITHIPEANLVKTVNLEVFNNEGNVGVRLAEKKKPVRKKRARENNEGERKTPSKRKRKFSKISKGPTGPKIPRKKPHIGAWCCLGCGSGSSNLSALLGYCSKECHVRRR